jgi:hypothetical protein
MTNLISTRFPGDKDLTGNVYDYLYVQNEMNFGLQLISETSGLPSLFPTTTKGSLSRLSVSAIDRNVDYVKFQAAPMWADKIAACEHITLGLTTLDESKFDASGIEMPFKIDDGGLYILNTEVPIKIDDGGLYFPNTEVPVKIDNDGLYFSNCFLNTEVPVKIDDDGLYFPNIEMPVRIDDDGLYFPNVPILKIMEELSKGYKIFNSDPIRMESDGSVHWLNSGKVMYPENTKQSIVMGSDGLVHVSEQVKSINLEAQRTHVFGIGDLAVCNSGLSNLTSLMSGTTFASIASFGNVPDQNWKLVT